MCIFFATYHRRRERHQPEYAPFQREPRAPINPPVVHRFETSIRDDSHYHRRLASVGLSELIKARSKNDNNNTQYNLEYIETEAEAAKSN